MTTKNLPTRRPAETTGASIGTAGLLALALGIPVETAAAILGVAAFAPAVVTWIINRGGIRGIARMLWGGD